VVVVVVRAELVVVVVRADLVVVVVLDRILHKNICVIS
jgi:hypothetical protein